MEKKKTEVRKIAEKIDVPSKAQKDSQDICFIEKPETLKTYLKNLFGEKKGDFIHIRTGKKLGEHTGYYKYTIGQRRGLEIASFAASSSGLIIMARPSSSLRYGASLL